MNDKMRRKNEIRYGDLRVIQQFLEIALKVVHLSRRKKLKL